MAIPRKIKTLFDGIEIPEARVTTPEIARKVIETQLPGGTFEIPIDEMDAMEATITATSKDANTYRLAAPGIHKIEKREIVTILKNSATEEHLVKTFINGACKAIPADESTLYEESEREFPYSVLRMQSFYDGKEVLLIDIEKGQYKVNGIDYSSRLNNLLK